MSAVPAARPEHQASSLARGVLARPPAPWLVVAGAKGGVGKTLLAVNLALQAARMGHRVLLADLDPGLGNVDVHLRLAARHTLEDAASGACTPAEAVHPGPLGIGVLPGRSGSTRLCGGDAAFLGRALAAVARAGAGFDLVVCDTGAGLGPAVLEAARRARLVLAVTTPDPAAVTDTYALCKVLHARGLPLPGLVVNRAAHPEQGPRTAARLAHVCSRFLSASPRYLACIPQDASLERSVLEQRPFSAWREDCAAHELRGLAAVSLSLIPGLRRSGARPAPGLGHLPINRSAQSDANQRW
ncbi:MAG: P-loop NTPase [Planctomycetes bacterium]|nr:P-loop NTPase [Planctomycetota bacterium]